MPDNRDNPPRKTPPKGIAAQIAPSFQKEDPTPVEGGPLTRIDHHTAMTSKRLDMVDRGQIRLEDAVADTNKRIDVMSTATNERIDGVKEEVGGLTARVGELTGAVGGMSGKMDILIQDRSHVKEIEKIDRITESRIAIVETRAELSDKNDKKSWGRKLWLTIAKLAGGVILGVAGSGFLSSLHC